MAFSTALVDLQDKCACFLCFDLFKNAVTIPCGHNFCLSCICLFWKGLNDTFPCPVCQISFPQRRFYKNPQIQNLVDIIKDLQRTQRKHRKPEKCTVCQKHNQPLALFCAQDLEVLCIQCSFSEEHETHHTCPVKRAASQHRRILEGHIEPLQCKVKEAEKVLAQQHRRALREQAEAQRCELNSEFERLNRCLDREQQAAFSRLKEEEKGVRQKLSKNIEAFEKRTSTLKSLLKLALAGKKSSEVDLLSTVKNFYKDYESLSNPDIFSPQLRREAYNFPLQYSALQKIVQQFTVQVTLDPDTAHQNLLVSEDKKCVTFSKKKQRVPDFLKRFTKSHAVLGFPNFSSGRHFWAVKVGEKSEWAVGICKANLSTGARQSLIPPGCWRIVWKGDCFEVSGDPKGSQLKATRPRVIGIFLDYELGEVSFYRMPEKSHICTIRDTFAEPVCPYFYVGNNSEPLRLCSATDAE
uniref:Tripartite motif-containing protein 75 n=1 Tax=Peromyscus maniculatus bairdii TaxID=230844 RepID=A0A8C8W732_PERMB